jgi:DNA-binding response OmpR family regulator
MRKRVLNERAEYLVGTGCVRIGQAVIELTVAEEELFELLLRTPKITVRYGRLEEELARSKSNILQLMKGLRLKLGTRAIRTHVGLGISVQPHYVGTASFRLQPVRHIGRVG